MRLELKDIRHDPTGFNNLITLAKETDELFLEDITLDLTNAHWIDADMCSPLGALLYNLSRRLNTVNIINIPSNVEKVLSRNDFLSAYGRVRLNDYYGTTIPYQRFEIKDGRYFADYIDRRLLSIKGIPKMSKGLSKKFRESVYEIFNNAVQHSDTQHGIFACGQLYRTGARIAFSLTDLGIGVPDNVNKNMALNLKDEEAIDWALSDKNTTKKGSIPGGLGLKLLREFITLNRGRIQIISSKGYWSLNAGVYVKRQFRNPFPGTIVNIEINTADTQTYALASEIDIKDIF